MIWRISSCTSDGASPEGEFSAGEVDAGVALDDGSVDDVDGDLLKSEGSEHDGCDVDAGISVDGEVDGDGGDADDAEGDASSPPMPSTHVDEGFVAAVSGAAVIAVAAAVVPAAVTTSAVKMSVAAVVAAAVEVLSTS